MSFKWAIERAKPETGDLLAARDGWELRAKVSGGGWFGFVLVAPPSELLKRKYFGGWNGERLSRSHDMGTLAKHKPPTYAWLTAVCPRVEWPRNGETPSY